MSLSFRPFNVLYIDPPWQYKNKKTGGSHTSGAAQKYDILSIADIKGLPISRIMDPAGSVCFMWITMPLLIDGTGPDVMRAWGFKPKAGLCWDKTAFGTGYWFRGQMEVLMFGIRGRVPAWRTSVSNYYSEPRSSHSRKPFYYRRLITEVTRLHKMTRRVEIFATTKAWNWTSWGNALDGRDIRDVLSEVTGAQPIGASSRLDRTLPHPIHGVRVKRLHPGRSKDEGRHRTSSQETTAA